MYIYIYMRACVCVNVSIARDMSTFLSIPSRGNVNVSSFKHPSSSAYWGFFAFDFRYFNAGMMDFLFPDFVFSPLLTNLKYYVFTYDLLKSVLIWCVCLHLMPFSGDSFWDRVWMMTEENCSFDNLLGKKIHCIFLGTH